MRNLVPINEHPVERTVRIVLGLTGIALVFVGPKSALGWFGLLPLLTGIFGTCPLYTALGVSTCRKAG